MWLFFVTYFVSVCRFQHITPLQPMWTNQRSPLRLPNNTTTVWAQKVNILESLPCTHSPWICVLSSEVPKGHFRGMTRFGSESADTWHSVPQLFLHTLSHTFTHCGGSVWANVPAQQHMSQNDLQQFSA